MRIFAWGPLFIVTLLAAPAAAQSYGYVTWDRDSATATCVDLGPAMDCDASTLCAGGFVCHVVADDGSGVCAPPGALFCIPSISGSLYACPSDRPAQHMAAGITFCVSTAALLCAGGTDLRFCFLAPDRPDVGIVDWESGDCDSDGEANGVDPTPCDLRRLAVAGPDGSCDRARRCVDDSFCEADESCRTIAPLGARGYCLRDGRGVVPCCGGFLAESCPLDGASCMVAGTTADDYGFCDPFAYCAELPFNERVRCLAYEGQFGVAPALGDCDGDRLRNAEDPEPCRENEDEDGGVARDAGMVLDAAVARDAGVPPDAALRDAGVPAAFDAASRTDAGGTDEQLSFRGGGGCACRAADTRGRDPRGLVVALLVMGVLAVRRRP